MKSWNLIFILLHCCGIYCAPSDTSSALDDGATEVSIPPNMNIADYYYSIFGKHLDYDYKEPLLTFDEPTNNELSDEILSEVDQDTDPWDSHSRRKRFVFVPASYFNATRRWAQQRRRLRMDRQRLRGERRRQWQQNRIRYLNARSESLQRQAALLKQLQVRQQVTRSVPEPQLQQQQGAQRIVLSFTTTSKPTSPNSLNNGNDVKSDPIPVEQFPIPT